VGAARLPAAGRPPGRQHLAELLFADADDPLGALRWTLAELRRALGAPGLFGATRSPLPSLPAWTSTCTPSPLSRPTRRRCWSSAASCWKAWPSPPARRSSPGWWWNGTGWRRRWKPRQAALSLLASGQAETAVVYAARVVARNPLEEGNHELLVRSLAAAGDRAAALRQVAVREDTLRRELGVEPSAALRDAAATPPGSPVRLPVSGRAAVTSQLEAGRAAIAAGAVQAGIDSLRRACADAAACADPALQGQALAALGGALVHAVRGRDEEGAAVLHEAIGHAARVGDRATAVTAHRELGFVELLAGRRQTAEAWLAKASALAETDDELAAIGGVRGVNASDMADYPTALRHLQGSVERAGRAANHRQQAWSLAFLARAHLLRDERSQAAVALAASLELVRDQRWMAFLPWPQALRGELELRAGHPDAAGDELERSWALACQLGDPCWEGMAARGLGLLHASRGDHATATAWWCAPTCTAAASGTRRRWPRPGCWPPASTTRPWRRRSTARRPRRPLPHRGRQPSSTP
jgi:tetratricopeptide (TPR) repeat protein